MSSQNHPGAQPFQVPLRASSILGARVREAEYLDLEARRRSSQIKSLMFIHLKKDLDPDPVNWVDCIDPLDVTDDARPKERRGPLTGYGVLKTVQARLAAIRTDLDSFTDVEAFALMLSGYRMTEHEFAACVEDIPTSNVQADDWRFLSVEKAMNRAKDFEEAHDSLMDILKASGSRAFKIWRLSRGLQVSGVLLLVSIATLLLEIWLLLRGARVVAGKAPLIMALFLILPAVAWVIFRMVKVRKPFLQLVSGFLLGVVGWTVARFHLWVFDPGFLAWGRVKSRQYSGAELRAAWGRPLAGFAVVALLVVVNPLTRAYLAEMRGDFASALGHWNGVLSVVSVPEAYLGRERANQKLGLYSAAIADYVNAIASMANPGSDYPGGIYASLKSGDYKAAASACLPYGAMNANVRAACDSVLYLLTKGVQPVPQVQLPSTLKPPIIANEQVFLASGKPNSKSDLADLAAEFQSAGFRVYDAQVRDDPDRPDTPEVRYFDPADKAQAEIVALFMSAKLKTEVPVTYKNARKSRYLEIWLGR